MTGNMTIELQLQQDGFLLTFFVGVSMRPMLTQRTEQLQIEKVAFMCLALLIVIELRNKYPLTKDQHF